MKTTTRHLTAYLSTVLLAVLIFCSGPDGGTVRASGILSIPATVVQTNQSNTYTTGTQNFSSAVHTAPTIVVASAGALPASGCVNGELAVVTGATPGQQIYENSGVGVCVWTQQLNTGSSSGGGVITYSGPAVSLTGTLFFPAGGGGLASSTEGNVDLASSSAGTVTNLSVQLNTALGVGNSAVFTWRKNNTSQSSTCTISGGSQTECQDTTHSFNVSQGDLLDYQVVVTGVVAGTPTVAIMSQFGTTQSGGTVNSGLINQVAWYAASGTAVSGLTTANNGVLCTSGGGVPSICTTLPNMNIGTPTAGVLTNTTGYTWANLASPPFVNNTQTSTYQVLAGDFTQCKTISVASGTFTITLVASGSQPANGQCLWIVNYGSGVVTVARSGQNINGGTTSLTLAAGSATAPTGAHIVSDGTNYFANLFAGATTNQNIRSIGAGFDGGGAALTVGKTAYVTVPFACTIAGYNILVDTGTISFDVWKIATGTAIPTVANTILTGGFLAISTGTALHSASTGLFTTTTSSANDIYGLEIQAVSSATNANLVLQCNAT